MGTVREKQKRVRGRSSFHEKVKILVSVLKAKNSQGFAIRAVVLAVKSLHAEHQLPLHTSEMQILRSHPRLLDQMLVGQLSICVLTSLPGDSDVKNGEMLHQSMVRSKRNFQKEHSYHNIDWETERWKQRLKQCMEWTPSALSGHAPLLRGYKSLPTFGETADQHLTLPAASRGSIHRAPQSQ